MSGANISWSVASHVLPMVIGDVVQSQLFIEKVQSCKGMIEPLD